MQIQFTLGNVSLDKSEASTIHRLGASKPLTVDLLDHIDPTAVNAESLFELSIEEKKPELAAVAAKFAMVVGKGKRKYNKSGQKNIMQIKPIEQDPFDSLEEIVSASTLTSVGAAMILNALADGGTRSLREIAEDQVNHLIDFGYLDKEDSPGLVKGFVWSKKSKWTANSDYCKGPLYHQSSVYTAMREGLYFLTKVGLVDTDQEIMFGALKKPVPAIQRKLQRKVYTVTLNDNGIAVMNSWADSEDFIATFWKMR